jgi:phospholipid-binding lipoprotein MlaA
MKDLQFIGKGYQVCRKRFLITFLVLNSLLMNGLAAETEQDASPSAVQKEALRDTNDEKLPFPGYQKRALKADYEETSLNVVSYSNYRDPLIGVNRVIFKINDVAYRFLLIPLAKGYTKITPDPVERCIRNFFYNIKTPIYAVNHLLQGHPKPMGRTLGRFGINTTIGILGLFDPARTRYKIEKEETHFEHTLSRYGVGYGFYLVIPFFGPSDVRRGVSSLVDHFLNPFTYITEFPYSTGIQAFDNFQEFAPAAPRYKTLKQKTDDPYIFFRNLYLQGVQRDDDYQKN